MGQDVTKAINPLENQWFDVDPVHRGGRLGMQGAVEKFRDQPEDPLGVVDSFRGSPEKQPIDWMANPITTQMGGDWMNAARMGGRAMAGYGIATGIGAATGAGAGAEPAASGTTGTGTAPATASAGPSPAVGGLNPGASAPEILGAGGESAVPGLQAGQNAGATMGSGTGSSVPASGMNVSPQAMQAFNAGSNLPFGNAAPVAFNAPTAPSASTGATQQPGGLKVGPNAAEQLGTPSTPGTGSTTPGTGTQTPPTKPGVVEQILSQMRNNAVPLGIMGASLYAAGKQRDMPSQQQMQGLSAEAQATANQLMSQYRAGQLSASQQAALDRLTQQTKNQVTQYFASIGQADSTAHQQALAQVDQQALGMRQQMLDNMLQQGLAAIGVASGPLNSIAQFQLGQDQALRQAYGSFAQAAGLLYGRSAGTQQPAASAAPTAAPTGSIRAPVAAEESPYPAQQALG